jgi:hypothetical protein
MQRLILICLSLLFLLAALPTAVIVHARREGVVNRVNFLRIAAGMDQARVQTLLGDPGQPLVPQESTDIDLALRLNVSDASRVQTVVLSQLRYSPIRDWRGWQDGDRCFFVGFVDGRVEDAVDASSQGETFFSRLRGLIEW